MRKHDLGDLIERRPYGRVFTSEAEKKIAEIVGGGIVPVWITHYDRDTVPFYQKPDKSNTDRVLNADLVVPTVNGGFGGEILGSGQRQDDPNEIIESSAGKEFPAWPLYEVTNIDDPPLNCSFIAGAT